MGLFSDTVFRVIYCILERHRFKFEGISQLLHTVYRLLWIKMHCQNWSVIYYDGDF